MPKTAVDTALPIEFSEVCEVLWGSPDTIGKSLFGTNPTTDAFQKAIEQGGTFHVDQGAQRDRLTNFRGYNTTTLDGKHRVVAANNNSIWVSHDYGATWTVPTGNPISTWNSVAISNDGVYILVGAHSSALSYRSNNSGVSFVSISGGYFLYSDMSNTGQYQVQLSSSTGQVRISSDYGSNWITKSVFAGTGATISISGNGQYIVVGYATATGNTYLSTNYGDTFTNIGLTDCYDITISQSGQYITLIKGLDADTELWQSSNYGVNFTRRLNTYVNFRYVAMSQTGQHQYTSIYTASGYNFYSSDYGVTWSQINPFLNTAIYDLDIGYSGIYGILATPSSGTGIIKDISNNLLTTNTNNYFSSINIAGPKIAVSKELGDTTRPSDVAGIPTVTNLASTSLTLNWNAATDNIGIAGYKIYNTAGTLLYTIGNVLTYNITGLTAGTAYTYKVKAYDVAGNESLNFSGTASVTTTTADTTNPSTPTNLTGAGQGSSINLNWTASTDNVGVAGYYIYRNSVQIATSATNSYIDSDGIVVDTIYSYYVVAYDAANNISDPSNTVNVNSGNIA